jgi:DNA polymerase-3 subunit beta
MKISCSQENLARGLAAVKPAVSSQSVLPILTHILLAASGKDGRLRLAATNLDMGIACWIPAQVEEAGAGAVPARLICVFVNTLAPEQIEMTLNAQTQV